MQIAMRQLAQIKPYHNNPRVNDPAVDAVAASIQEFGFNQPVVVDQDDVIIVGHTRFKAAAKIGLEEIPVYVADHLTPAQAKGYRIADNQTNRLSDWDQDRLVMEILQLQEMDFNLDLTGFSAAELSSFLAPAQADGFTDPDDIPELPDKATTQPGDLYRLDHHLLLCGDAGNPRDVDRLAGGQQIHLVHTDPPYNVNVEPRSKNAIAAGQSSFTMPHPPKPDAEPPKKKSQPTRKKLRARDRRLDNDFVSEEKYQELLQAWFSNMARVLVPGRGFYLWGGWANCANYPPVLKANGLYFSQALIWHKMHPVLTRKDFMGDHEWCFYGWKTGAAHKFYGPNNIPDVWPIKKINPQAMTHLTEKPVELAERALTYSSKPGEHVLDLFAGSGSTLIAAERTGRKAFLMELDALYCDQIVARWQKYTGRQAELVKAVA